MGANPVSKSDDEQWNIESGADAFIQAQKVKADKKLWPKVQKELAKRAEAAKRATLEAGVAKGMAKSFPEDK